MFSLYTSESKGYSQYCLQTAQTQLVLKLFTKSFLLLINKETE